MLFRGINPLSLDNKGRFMMPAKYRDSLDESYAGHLIMTIDRDRCLLLYPLPVWEGVEQKLIQLSSTHPQARSLKRLLLGHAEECRMDGQGRILISPPLRDFAHLEKRAVLIGQGNKFEIWDEQTWYRLRDEWLEGAGGDGDRPADLESLAF
jgi:MraZ protein